MDTPTVEWTTFEQTITEWFHKPDFMVLRACLAAAKSLDLDTTPVWVMVIGPSSCGKSELYLYSCQAYSRWEKTSDISIPGIISFDRAHKGEGILQRIGRRGLWLIGDFSSILGLPEENRNRITSACREIYDGEYSRELNGEKITWRGRCNIIAACTPAIERYYRVHADLGERFLQVQLERLPQCRELRHKANQQRRRIGEYHTQVKDAASTLLNGYKADIEVSAATDEKISYWAEFIAIARTTVSHNGYTGEITDVGYAEGAGRLYQQLTSLALGDAALFHQDVANGRQLDLVQRIALDSLSRNRRAILRAMLLWEIGEPIRRVDLQQLSEITHPQTFTRTIEDLVAISVLEPQTRGTEAFLTLSPGMLKVVRQVT